MGNSSVVDLGKNGDDIKTQNFLYFSIMIKIKLEYGGYLPRKHYCLDAGWDIYSSEYVTIPASSVKAVETGLRIRFPHHLFGMLRDRSSMILRGLSVQGGVLDSGYSGLIRVLVRNQSDTSYLIKKGDAISQLIVCELHRVTMQQISDSEEDDEEGDGRGECGFGSTNSVHPDSESFWGGGNVTSTEG